MHGYGSYYSTNQPYDYYSDPEGYYEAASGPSTFRSHDPYGEHYNHSNHAYASQYSTQSHYYDGGYHEAGARLRYHQYHSRRPYEQRYMHSSTGNRPPPRAPKAMRAREQEKERTLAGKGLEDDGDREVTPPPAPSPSPEYLALAANPPSTLSDPSSSRKLLVLDLNGTLVFRSPHVSRPKYRPQDRGVPRLRATFPRPYMRAFREYVFAPETKAWLDVMVWSSAQPHSVTDMVDKCFGEHKRELVAVWARDTLGLSSDHYHRKIQTIKDLSKPWAALPALLTPLPPSPSHSSDRSTPPPLSSSPPERSSSPARSAKSAGTQAHSALTTLLLDDSPKKAAMQPYNHCCIPEYTHEQRNRDLESFQREQEWALVLEKRELLRAQEEKSPLLYQEDQEATPQVTSTAEDEVEPRSSKKRKRKGEDVAANVQIPSFPSPSAADDSPTSPPEPKKEKKKAKRRRHLEELARSPDIAPPEVSYDETLLAVVGVLDAVRSQSNVAAWIRAGGLWGPVGPPTRAASSASSVASSGDERAAIPPARTDAPDDTQLEGGKKKRKKPRHRTLRRQAEIEAAGLEAADATASPERGLSPAGNDEATAAATPPGLKLTGQLPASADAPEVPSATMWFEDPQVVTYWATRGREVLEEMGISVEHGMER